MLGQRRRRWTNIKAALVQIDLTVPVNLSPTYTSNLFDLSLVTICPPNALLENMKSRTISVADPEGKGVRGIPTPFWKLNCPKIALKSMFDTRSTKFISNLLPFDILDPPQHCMFDTHTSNIFLMDINHHIGEKSLYLSTRLHRCRSSQNEKYQPRYFQLFVF